MKKFFLNAFATIKREILTSTGCLRIFRRSEALYNTVMTDDIQQGEGWREVELDAVERPANLAKIAVMQSLLEHLRDDDVNAVYIALHTAMAELGFKFISDPMQTLNRIERANPDV